MTEKEVSSDTTRHSTNQKIGGNNYGKIESSFERLLKWRESEHLRVLNIAERYDSSKKDKLQLDDEDTESRQTKQTRLCND